MLIRSVRAENFMRFAHLQLLDLPDDGLIGIEGPNESGKSTIGEAILFGFFGRTRLGACAPLGSLIRWGAKALSVEIEFSVLAGGAARAGAPSGRQEFLLFREIDRCGTNYVKVVELPSRREVAAGNIQVADFFARQIGFDFPEFQQSFYHGQIDSSAGQVSQAAFFESATGVQHLREAIEALQRDLEPMEREFTFCEKEIARNSSQVEKYGHNAAKLPELTARLARIVEQEEVASRRVKDLRRKHESLRAEMAGLENRARQLEGLAASTLEKMLADLETLRSEEEASVAARVALCGEDVSPRALQVRDEIQGLLSCAQDVAALRQRVSEEHRFLTGALADGPDSPAASRSKVELQEKELARACRRSRAQAGAFLGWAALTGGLAGLCFADAPLVREALASIPPGLRATSPWALAGLAGLGLLLSALAIRKLAACRRRRAETHARRAQIDEEAARLSKGAGELERLLEARDCPAIAEFVRRASAASDRRIAEAARDLSAKHRGCLEGAEKPGLVESILRAAKLAREARARCAGVAHRHEKQIQEETSCLKKLQAEREKAENEMRECQSQAAKKESLESRSAELELSAARIQGEMDLRLLACRLLEETMASIREKVGPGLTDFVKVVLPRLTAGRYKDLRVDGSLAVLVYSSEKNDFLSLAELSGGTHEALHLALRLAVSQALVSARIRQAQFTFLDEPFKMMDEVRVGETLHVLPLLSPDLRQFFVIQPEFTPEQRGRFCRIIRTSREETSLCSSSIP